MKNNLTFNPKTYPLINLINDIDTGNIALPDLQRPFVWDTTKARDLVDSLYKGLPIGLIILWEILEVNSYKKINQNNSRDPRFLVIDGQQRLTSLFSIIKGKEIISKNVKKFKIKISFNPLYEKFEVFNPAIGKNIEWISDISTIFDNNSTFSLVNNYLKIIKSKEIDFDENIIAQRIEKVRNILNYPFSVLELSTELDPEEVSEIFVRINSKGQTLNQSDFILTLMSVYWPEGREILENFCIEAHHIKEDNKASSFNLINLKPTPEQLIRTIVGYAFKRGRLKYAYLILKGRDFENKVIDENLRVKNFEKFKISQRNTLDLTNWHDFIKIIHSAGFINENLISSQVALYITYAFYLIGKEEFRHDYKVFESSIKKWFVFSILTQRYTGSPESKIEDDFNKILKEDIITFIDKTISLQFTNDFWDVLLPEKLESSSTRNFAYLTYVASQIFFDINILFSNIKVKDHLNPFIKSKKKAIDVHHIFPKNYLKKELNLQVKDINQIANLTYLEYKDNIKIGDKHPQEYWISFFSDYSKKEIDLIYNNYDLPDKFYQLDYFTFLQKRRLLIAKKLKKYFLSL